MQSVRVQPTMCTDQVSPVECHWVLCLDSRVSILDELLWNYYNVKVVLDFRCHVYQCRSLDIAYIVSRFYICVITMFMCSTCIVKCQFVIVLCTIMSLVIYVALYIWLVNLASTFAIWMFCHYCILILVNFILMYTYVIFGILCLLCKFCYIWFNQ